MLFHERVRAAQAAGRLGTCKCWDCVRAAGLTPPFQIRDKFKTVDRPPVTYDKVYHPEASGDPDGVPQPNRQSRSGAPKKQAKERRHLREAVRNREAI